MFDCEVGQYQTFDALNRSTKLLKQIRLTVIVDYVFYITHDLGVPALGHAGLLVDGLCILLKNSCRLRVEDEWDGQETLTRRQYISTA